MADDIDIATQSTAESILSILDKEDAAAEAADKKPKRADTGAAGGNTDKQTDDAEGADDAAEADEVEESEAEEADDAGAEEEPPTDDDAEDGEQDDKADKKAKVPAIDAPASYSAEEKAEFAKLPPAMQRTQLRRESERDAQLTKRTEELVNAKKAAEAAVAATESERQKYAAELVPIIQGMAATFLDEFADIKSPADLQKLANDDPARYSRFAAKRDAINAAQAEVAKLEDAKRADQKKWLDNHLAEQRKLLVEKWPDMADPEKGKGNRERVIDYLKGAGYTEQDLTVILSDHRAVLMVRDALRARELDAAEAERVRKADEAKRTVKTKQVKKPAKSAKPGTAEDKGPNGEQHAALKQRAMRSGKTADTVAAALAILG